MSFSRNYNLTILLNRWTGYNKNVKEIKLSSHSKTLYVTYQTSVISHPAPEANVTKFGFSLNWQSISLKQN